tara:strand:- start:861 stop:1187 length:327 start_codon:yes stop_codon:yes gene_type:complete
MSKHTGQVKWFSRDRGLGFIREIFAHLPDVSDTNDIFVHYTGLKTDNDVYKTLYDGEYIEYDESVMEDGRKIATNVTGIFGNELMCENVFKKKQNNKSRKQNENQNDE